ncbi:SGNH/GDSL hydrolase family protein [Novosphingobium sp. 1949]|uniref:SGNH/GDSL hydrolase family protein n=1 Tax=Novosphingobium organovorum TaxID=2930092 RepID=A0ABT0BCJ1_9SPHN|nr:SGNH/GDSL hydrolase family protein [Novosphingobium organovorum]MCJ2182521.1 SGNH/GDSL hydrolase family protein [Novosphingobium organovorum]
MTRQTPYSIMCFGDSLTWGWVPNPDSVPTTRYGLDARWTRVMAKALGEDYAVIEEGLNARTTNQDDPTDPRLNGSAYLPTAVASHLPLDLVILMLGTNDTKAVFRREPIDIVTGMSVLVGQVLSSAGGVGSVYPAPHVLVVAPPALAAMPDPCFAAMFEGAKAKTEALAKGYRDLARFLKVDFLDAGEVITTDGSDGIHLSAQANAVLGAAMADKVREILA